MVALGGNFAAGFTGAVVSHPLRIKAKDRLSTKTGEKDKR
jgi:hypothetical protein